jgi:hypothetical protein
MCTLGTLPDFVLDAGRGEREKEGEAGMHSRNT